MQPFPTTSQTFSADQQWDFSVTGWDTPFTVLEGGVASGGIIFDLVEPKDTSAATWKAFVDAFKSATQNASALAAFTGNANIIQQVSNGRVDNLAQYWAAGAPGQHGATVSGRVAYHFKGYLRSAAARGWFSTLTTPTWYLALAGNGYFRIDKTVSGVVTTIFSGMVTEKDFLVNGFSFTPTISNMAAGDSLDIYYIQTGTENWGGYCINPVAAARVDDPTDQAAAQAATILGCGLLDDNSPPAAQTFHSVKSVTVDSMRGKPMSAELELPLLNAAVTDGTGWKWVETSPDDPGVLQLYEGGSQAFTLKRKRLIQIIGGFLGEQYTLFTGLIQDYSEPANNSSTLTCQGFEMKLVEQHDKNYPDPISYMNRGYKRTTSASGTSEPIYPIPAYDNWPVEYALADLLQRNGVDASRISKNLFVPKSDGTTSQVLYSKYNGYAYPQDLDQAVWIKTFGGAGSSPVVTANYAIAPDGTQTADRVQMTLNGANTSADISSLNQFNTPAVFGTWTHSVWMKSNTGVNQSIIFRNNVQLTVTVTPQWQRFTQTQVLDGIAHTLWLCALRGGAGTNDTADISVWGAKWEPTPYATPYYNNGATPVTTPVDFFSKFRARTLGGKLLRMDRPVHYGNANIGFDESIPSDDAYLFKPEVTKEVWNRMREMSERLGYELRFDEFGDAVLRPRNNPATVYDIAAGDCTGSPTVKTNPSAYAAQFLEWTTAAPSFKKDVSAARIDVAMPLGPTLGQWHYTVEQSMSAPYFRWAFDDSTATDTSGFGHHGTLRAGVRINYNIHSNFDSLTGWTTGSPTGTTLNAILAPDNTNTAMTWTGGGRLFQENTAGGNITYTSSIYAKAVSGTVNMTIVVKDCVSDTVRGTFTVALTSNWTRYSVTGTTAGATTGYRTEITISGGGTIGLWGSQVEPTSIMTALITTTTAAVTVNETPVFSSGKTGLAYVLDGLNDYVELADNASLKYTGGNLSIAAWIAIDPAETDTGYIYSKGWNASGQYNYQLERNANGTLTATLLGATSYALTTVATVPADLSWHHVAVTMTSAGLVTIYIDGVVAASGTHSIVSWVPTLGDANIALAVGTLYPYGAGWTGVTSQALKGMIDDVRYYTVALAQVEVTALVNGITVASGLLACSGSPNDVYFFDGALNADASNATVATLYSGDFGTYTVTLTGTNSAATRRLDCLLLYHTDPVKPLFPKTLSTAVNALKVQAQSAMDDMRNSVTVVGRRKATVTDSDKFNNPNNPEGEFIVERLVDKASVTNPSATNYIGAVKESIIYDSTIADNAYARYLARVFIYRYRNPRPAVAIDHTLLPQLQSGDPIYGEETRYKTVSVDGTDPRKSVLWATGYRHTIEGKKATTSITTQSFPDFPAFEPREDIDLTAFNGKPVINVSVSYVSLTGETKTNLTSSAPYVCVEGTTSTSGGATAPGDWVQVNNVSVTNGVITLPSNNTSVGWPPVPGTVFIQPVLTSPTTTSATRRAPDTGTVPLPKGAVLPAVKLPYLNGITAVVINGTLLGLGGFNKNAGTDRTTNQFYYEVNDDDVITVGASSLANVNNQFTAFAQITWTQAQKDAKLGYVTNNPYHHFFNVDYRDTNRTITLVWNQGDNGSALYQRASNANAYNVKYRRLGPVSASGAFSDPYSGTSPFFDPYTSELGYTVNVKGDFLVSGLYRVSVRNLDDNTVVAWLTEPLADNTKPESHWQYFTAGASKQFAWDGVDNIGTWNQKQSIPYAAAASGAFEENQRVIGAGYYVWNRELDDNKPGPMALIAGTRDANTGMPVFGHGTFGRWYIYIECKTDSINTVVRTDQLDSTNNGGATQALVFTHLPEPTKIEMAIKDWTSGTDFNQLDLNSASAASAFNPANWGAANADATINNQHPVRIRLQVAQRPGVLWNGLATETTIKLSRVVHLRANLFDQFVVFNGQNWPNSSFEDRAIYNRRLTNDEHTLKYEDDGYRKASSLKWLDSDSGTEWVFYPSLFKKNFRGFDESIVFGDYLQLEEVPKWDDGQRNKIAGTRARMQIAFMNYLWYLSAFVTDRSGRSVWATNRNFLDKSKIVNNVVTDWPQPGAAPTTNSVLQSRTFNVTWSMVNGTVTMNQVGIDGTTNTAATVADTSAAGYGLLSQTFTIPNDSNPIAAAYWIKKDSTTNRFPQLYLAVLNGTTTGQRRACFNTSTGAFVTVNTTGPGISGSTTVEDTGSWWIVRMTFNNNSTGNTSCQVGIYPSPNATLGGVDDVTVQGSLVVGQIGVALNSTFVSGPLFTTTTAITTPTIPFATVDSYRIDWPDDMMMQHRRTVITRQWADEKINGTDWRATQRTRFNIASGEIGDQLLRHKWQDHSPASTTINGVAWSSFANLTADNYTNWHALAGRQPGSTNNPALPTTYTNTRQLATLGASCIWAWEQGPNWIPCITRDFHGYRMMPPMVDKDSAKSIGWQYQGGTYECVDMRPYDNSNNKNEAADPAAGEVWTSPVYDMTTTYDTSTSGTVRFWPGHKVSTTEEPTKTKGVLVSTVDYVRQDELVHWEDLRGLFSRGKRPTEQPIKVNPVQPYYQNVFRYGTIVGDSSYQNGTYPLFRAGVTNWFRMSFRSEYFWESGSMFPTSLYGIEKLAWMNAAKARHNAPASMSTIKYDTGAWTGWKDDIQGGANDVNSGNKVGTVSWNVYTLVTGAGRILTPFESDQQVAAIGPELSTTKDMIFHMVLVPERRSVAV